MQTYSYLLKSGRYISSMIFPEEASVFRYDLENGNIINETWLFYMMLLGSRIGLGSWCENIKSDYLITLSTYKYYGNVEQLHLKKNISLNDLVNNRKYSVPKSFRRPIEIKIYTKEGGERECDLGQYECYNLMNKIKKIDKNTLLLDLVKFDYDNTYDIKYIKIEFLNRIKTINYDALQTAEIKDLV